MFLHMYMHGQYFLMLQLPRSLIQNLLKLHYRELHEAWQGSPKKLIGFSQANCLQFVAKYPLDQFSLDKTILSPRDKIFISRNKILVLQDKILISRELRWEMVAYFWAVCSTKFSVIQCTLPTQKLVHYMYQYTCVVVKHNLVLSAVHQETLDVFT